MVVPGTAGSEHREEMPRESLSCPTPDSDLSDDAERVSNPATALTAHPSPSGHVAT